MRVRFPFKLSADAMRCFWDDMIKRTVLLLTLLTAGLGFSGCGPSYPKDSVTVSIEKLLKKEFKLIGHAKIIGETVYLEVILTGLVSTEQKVLTEILKKVQGAALIITRVSLSSDAKISNMVLVVSEPRFGLNLRIIQRLDDIKGFLYQKISKQDYEERLVLEIEPAGEKPYTLESEMLKNGDIGAREFTGRLIVSQINMLSRSNPFLAVVLGNTQLKYIDFRGDELVVGVSNTVAKTMMPFFEDIIRSQAQKIAKKNLVAGPLRIKLMDGDNKATLIELAGKTANAKP